MANVGYVITNFSRLFCSCSMRKSLIRAISLTRLQRSVIFSRTLSQVSIVNKEIVAATKTLTSTLQRRWSTSVNPDDCQSREAKTTDEKGHPNRRTLYVGSLNFLTGESRLKDHFSQFGEVEKIRILHKTSSMIPNGYAFVQFKTVESLNNALKGKHFVDSRKLEVRKHDYDSLIESKIHIKDIPSDLSENEIKEHFSQFGNVESLTIPLKKNEGRGDFGFVAFSSEDAALKALEKTLHDIRGSVIKASTFIAKRRRVVPGKVVVDLLPDNITLEDVKKYFEEFAPLNSIDMVFHRGTDVAKNFAFLAFQDENVAHNIMIDNKKHYINGQEVIVQPMYSTAKLRPLSRERKVFVEGIPLGKTEEEICDFFNQFGEALHVHLVDSWAKQHATQCGIVRFRKKEDVDNVISQPQINIDGCELAVRRLGYTAKTSPDYTPLYLEFRKKHRQRPTSTKDDPNVVIDEVEHKALHRYPNLK